MLVIIMYIYHGYYQLIISTDNLVTNTESELQRMLSDNGLSSKRRRELGRAYNLIIQLKRLRKQLKQLKISVTTI